MSASWDVSKIRVGDIIFADWGYSSFTLDGKIEHVMIVTKIQGTATYGRVREAG